MVCLHAQQIYAAQRLIDREQAAVNSEVARLTGNINQLARLVRTIQTGLKEVRIQQNCLRHEYAWACHTASKLLPNSFSHLHISLCTIVRQQYWPGGACFMVAAG
jgi:hypothetical protein